MRVSSHKPFQESGSYYLDSSDSVSHHGTKSSVPEGVPLGQILILDVVLFQIVQLIKKKKSESCLNDMLRNVFKESVSNYKLKT